MFALLAVPSLADLAASYSVKGTNSDGSTYTGTAKITAAGQVYHLDFVAGDGSKLSGVVLQYQNFLALAEIDNNGDGDLALYQQAGDGWAGIFTGYGDNDLAAEVMYINNAAGLPDPSQSKPDQIAGTYLLSGTNPDGSTYTGEVELTVDTGTLDVDRTIGSEELTGTAIAFGGAFAMNISTDDNAATIGVVGLFIPQNGGFLGVWAKAGSQKLGAERWVRK